MNDERSVEPELDAAEARASAPRLPFAAALAAALVVAAAVRLLHVSALRDLPLLDHLIIDSRRYDAWAQRIAVGNWMGGDGPFFMEPLHPYFRRCFLRQLDLTPDHQGALLHLRFLGAAPPADFRGRSDRSGR